MFFLFTKNVGINTNILEFSVLFNFIAERIVVMQKGRAWCFYNLSLFLQLSGIIIKEDILFFSGAGKK